MVKPEKNKSENQKTAELLRLMFKGKTVKTARPHKNPQYVTLFFTDGSKLILHEDIFWNVNGDVVEPGDEPGTVKFR